MDNFHIGNLSKIVNIFLCIIKMTDIYNFSYMVRAYGLSNIFSLLKSNSVRDSLLKNSYNITALINGL